MTKFLKIILTFSLYIFALNIRALDLSVSPLIIYMDVIPGVEESFQFKILPKDDGVIKISRYKIGQKITGHSSFYQPNMDDPIHEIVTLNDIDNKNLKYAQYKLIKGESKIITGSIKLPKSSKKSFMFALMVEEDLSENKKEGVNFNYRYAVIISVNNNRQKKHRRIKIKVSNIEFKKLKNKNIIVAELENMSNSEFNLSSKVSIKNTLNKNLETLLLKTQAGWESGSEQSIIYPNAKVKIYGAISKSLNDDDYLIYLRNKVNNKPKSLIRKKLRISPDIKKTGENKKLKIIKDIPDEINFVKSRKNSLLGYYEIKNNSKNIYKINIRDNENIKVYPNNTLIMPHKSKKFKFNKINTIHKKDKIKVKLDLLIVSTEGKRTISKKEHEIKIKIEG